MLLLLISTFLASHDGGGLPMKAPKSVGMSSQRLAVVDRVVQRGISAGGYPGAAVVIGRRGAAVWEKGFGKLGWERNSSPVTADRTIYDLASLTKVVGTTTALMVLFDEGKISLDDPVSKYVPDFSGGEKDRVTVRMLLEHRSGLPAGTRPLAHRARHRLKRAKRSSRRRSAANPAAATSTPISAPTCSASSSRPRLASPSISSFTSACLPPLGMNDTFFRPADSLKSRVAPTEVAPPRGYPLQGEVHDENAFALGGVAGHAGLFSTAADLSIFAQMMLNGGEYDGTRLIADSTVALFTKRAAGTRALGWDTCGGEGSCGDYLGEDAYGHTGFTGTSLWIDPDRDMFVILLTNRVHEARAKRPAKVIADVRADLSDAAALAVTDYGTPPAMPASFRADKAVGWNRPIHTARHHSKKKPVKKPSAAKK